MQGQVKTVANERHISEQRESLAAAFEFFNETSQQLAQSYHMLEQRVQLLSRELDKVAEEKAMEHQKKQEIAGQMQALLKCLPGGVIVLDAKGRVVEANPAAEELLGLPLCGRLWREAIAECFSPRSDDGLEVSTQSGRRISIATSSMGNDGQIILLTDQSETRKLQASLSRYEKLSAMGKMVSALAHQIRTPLSAAMLYAGHLRNHQLAQDKREVFAEKLYSRLQHMEKQVRDMMLFVKSELPLNDVVSLADLELGLREAAEVALAQANASCEWRNHFPTKKIKCHRDALISALMNLVNNGIQACDEAPQLIIDLRCNTRDSHEWAEIRVIDKGQGMAPAHIEEAQTLFVTTKAQGTGIGLSVVQSVARAHGGQFSLSSELGRGTEALIVVPTLQNTSADA